jgi:hypothetical protein
VRKSRAKIFFGCFLRRRNDLLKGLQGLFIAASGMLLLRLIGKAELKRSSNEESL